MIEIGPAREAEVVLAFLSAEIDSPKFSIDIQKLLQKVGLDRTQLIDNADICSDYENAARGAILQGYRGYVTRNALFDGFPRRVEWRRVELEPSDLSRLRYLNYPEWLNNSNGTRCASQASSKIDRGELPELAKKVAAIKERLQNGERLKELVAVEGNNGDLILIEGANRATAYMALGWNTNLPVLIGHSPLMRNWRFF